MPDTSHLLAFALIALAMVLTPGPNMIYLLSRTLCQGYRAGLISLCGVALGFFFYMLCAALGITGLLLAVPYAYDALRWGGAAYLLYLAWQAWRPNARVFTPDRSLPADPPLKLFWMGCLTNLLNPKVAILYLSLLPQFIDPHAGASVLSQSLVLGTTQIGVSLAVNASIILLAGRIAAGLNQHPAWARAQRWLMGTVLAGLALRMVVDTKR